jgi:hypothetical protein
MALSASGCVDFRTAKSSVPTTLTREERLKIAKDASLEFECEKLWDALWPLAREGDGEALLNLAYSFSLGRVQLPDTGGDVHSQASKVPTRAPWQYMRLRHQVVQAKANLAYFSELQRMSIWWW